MQVFFIMGEFLLVIIAVVLPAWRAQFAAGAVLCGASTLLWFVVPESGRWLQVQGRAEEAQQVGWGESAQHKRCFVAICQYKARQIGSGVLSCVLLLFRMFVGRICNTTQSCELHLHTCCNILLHTCRCYQSAVAFHVIVAQRLS